MPSISKNFESLRQWLEGRGKKQAVIYGGGMVAVSVYYAIKTLYGQCKVVCFLVSQREGNPAEIDQVPVIGIEEYNQSNVKILIAAPENHHREIVSGLEQRNLRNYVCIDSRTEAALMEQYYNSIGRFPALGSFQTGDIKASLDVYMARFYKDKPLENPYEPAAWVHTIQAGAALTPRQIADLRDDRGENISKKNGNYSELSAMYWIGKHGKNDYLGLFHYRRVLDVSEEDLLRIGGSGIDVILPYPSVHYPSAEEHHKRYLKDRDWEAMVSALEELAPEYAGYLPQVLSQPFFYNFNMMIARESVFKGYCQWLFPILERTEELSVPRGWERADRYIGYLGENLTTLYFMYHSRDFLIGHTGRLMLI